MTLDSGTTAIIELAWCRLLKFSDAAFAEANGERLYRQDHESCRITFVRLFGQEALVGPGWAIEAAADMDGADLSLSSTLLRLSREHGGRALQEAKLYFCDSLPSIDARPGAAVARDSSFAVELERLCPPDDVAEVKLSGMAHRSILVDDSGGGRPVPLTGAGYDEWEGILAHMGVLTAPSERRRGRARYITSIAVEEALASGLIPQWRARPDNPGSQLTALGAGFVEAGSQTTVALAPGG